MKQPPAATPVDTSTRYLGLRLRHPFIAGASPLAAHLDGVKRLEDGGAAAIVLHSLFEEQITEASSRRIHGVDPLDDPALAPLVAMFPPSHEYPFAPDEHLEHVRRVKDAVAVPVIASLNGTSTGHWLDYAKEFERAGADAIELNYYEVVADPAVPADAVERQIAKAVDNLKRAVRIPVAVKLGPYFSAFANMAARLDRAGADGLVLFNRFYQPDIDIETLSAGPSLELSRNSELRLRLRWLALLHGQIRPSLAVTGGVETWQDGVKAILAGAHAVQIVSAVLRHGESLFSAMVDGMTGWMERHHLASVDDMRGLVSARSSPDPGNFERANYIRTLHTWEGPRRG
jgi:dihydroorotate dehydrogenase (fumarate)